MATGPMIRAACLKVLTDMAGKPVHVDTIVERTNFEHSQVKASLNHMVKDGLPIEVINKSVLWVYTGQAEPEPTAAPTTGRAGELWEVVGVTKSTGALILRDENGILYRATEME